MRRVPFNDGWMVGSTSNSFAELIAGPGSEPAPVALPHDAMIGADRSAAGHAATAFFPSGNWEYKKSFEPPAEDQGGVVLLEFEGIYREARAHDDSRWYSGGGLYRSAWLLQGGGSTWCREGCS